MAKKTGGGYVGWEEVAVSGDKGRREVHYYLRDASGGMDLAVVGRERSARHMSFAVAARFARSCGPDAMVKLSPSQPFSSPSSLSCTSTVTSGATTGSYSSPSPPSSSSSAASLSLKWRSRREVIGWLSSMVSGASLCSSLDDFWDDDVDSADGYTMKGIPSEKMSHHSKGFSWLGSAWTCRKQRKHYHSFCRYGITISVHDFVFVMAEENRRLVAYVEDLFEDLKARKKVVVRWFHKIDEVNVILPPDVNDREIFFSLCLQDLSVECIDGLAAVLSAQHFEKYLNEAENSPWKPFLCRRQIDNEDVKPFDITHLQGYWKQEVLRCMFDPKLHLKSSSWSMSASIGDDIDGLPNHKPKRKSRLTSENVNGSLRLKFRRVGDAHVPGGDALDHYPLVPLPPKKGPEQLQEPLSAGCHVEVLSQDSGLRGCWFRCVIVKRHQDKVKVKYQDLQDAEGMGHLQEWILASRVAVADKLGIRLQGRSRVRPQPSPRSKLSPTFGVGSVVDAWWHDGWWEGIVISKDAEHKINVYFPGERRTSVFGPQDLRASQDWSGNRWISVRGRPELVSSLLSGAARVSNGKDSQGCTISQVCRHMDEAPAVCLTGDDKIVCQIQCPEGPLPGGPREEGVSDLAFDDLLARLKWRSSRKRCPRLFTKSRPNLRQTDANSSGVSHVSAEESSACMKLLASQSLMVDSNCKFRDPFLIDSTAISNLVVSR